MSAVEEPDGLSSEPVSSRPPNSHDHPGHPPDTAPFLPEAWWGLAPHRRRQVALGVAAAVVLVVGFGLYTLVAGGGGSDSSTDDDVAAAGSGTTTTTIDAAAYVAALPTERVDTFNSLAQCESSGDWSDDTGNGFYGGLQFTLESWETVGGTGNPADASQNEQIARADMLEQLQGWTAWPECAAELGLT